jgi:Family of unknown function (DUF6869)
MARPDLDALIDEERIDEVLQIVTLTEVAETWIRYQREQQESDWWAVSLWLSQGWWSDEARVRDGLLRLVNVAESDEDFATIGAGPLEVFVSDDESRVRWIERHAPDSPRLRRALANVWAWELPDKLFWRVERAAGTKLNDPYAEHGIRQPDED